MHENLYGHSKCTESEHLRLIIIIFELFFCFVASGSVSGISFPVVTEPSIGYPQSLQYMAERITIIHPHI